jgi:hypothetical protein
MVTEEIVINVTDNGLDSAAAKIKSLGQNTENASNSQKSLARSLKSSATSVLENGGAMGLLNDATGGYAMQVKDAVEASVLFTKSQKTSAITQNVYTAVVGTSTGALKLFRIALASTGIGAIVIGLGLLVANFTKVKESVLDALPSLKLVEKVIGSIIRSVTDFVGVTNDATRSLASLVSASERSLKKNQDFLATDSDKYDQYTKAKIESVNKFNEAVKSVNADETKTTAEKLVFINKLRDRANRDVSDQDKQRLDERQKKEKEAQEKLNDLAEKEKEKADALAKERVEKEKARLDGIEKINEDYRNKIQDLDAKTDEQKRDLEEKRKLAELDTLNASESQKQAVRDFYNKLSLDLYLASIEEKKQIDENRVVAENQLLLNQRQFEIDNMLDGESKLQAQKNLLELQGEFDLEKLQHTIDSTQVETQARLDAEIAYNDRKQKLDQASFVKEKEISKLKIDQEKQLADAKKQIQAQGVSVLEQGIGFVKGLFAENQEIQKASLIAESAVGIAKIIQSTQAANAAALATPQAVLTSGAAAIPVIAFNNISAGLGIAGNILATTKALSALGGGSSPSPQAGGSGAPAPPAAPSFNLVQGTGSNQIATAIGSQTKPIQAYVVSSNVTTAQELDRNIIKKSKI